MPWMQIIADITGRRVETVRAPQEAGAVGVALAAGVGLGLYPNFGALKEIVQVEHHFEPQAGNAEIYNTLYSTYRRLYRTMKGLYRDVNSVRFGAE
jgi:sugar (pentulose or hexulose) kinase